MRSSFDRGFTLIELSIVLVIIGLLVAGVLVGQDLIRAAAVRAQITQIEKFNTAVNTFRAKYGALPGDIKDPDASNFGFLARGSLGGQGDGNGILQGNAYSFVDGFSQAGENLMFWVDLSTANLLEGNFSSATPTYAGTTTPISGSALNAYLPQAKIGNGNYIYVFSGGWAGSAAAADGTNYFGLGGGQTSINSSSCKACLFSQVGLTVQQANNIDKKTDDGLPTTGNILSAYLNSNNWNWGGSSPQGSLNAAAPITATNGNANTCFDNGGNASNPMQYSVAQSGGANINCGLIFRFQ